VSLSVTHLHHVLLTCACTRNSNKTFVPNLFCAGAAKNMAGNALCCRWIEEYDCWRMWTQFSQFNSVDDIPNLASLISHQDAQNPGDHRDKNTSRHRLLMSFMCKISEAANEESADGATEHDVTPPQTTLEDAIDLFDDISHCYREMFESGELNEVKLCLRRHAVLAPLRKGDQTLAKVSRVFFCNLDAVCAFIPAQCR